MCQKETFLVLFVFRLDSILEGSLYAINYKDNNDEFENNEFDIDQLYKNEFRRLFNNWSDVEYLEAFFEKNKSDLDKNIFNFISVSQAIEETIEESLLLEAEIIKIAEFGKTDLTNSLQILFKPLNKRDEVKYPIPILQASKVYGSNKPSWLRIYAIRLSANSFIITGGGIKLVRRMEEREHLQKELFKLESVKSFLIQEGIIDNDELIDFFEIN